MAYYPAEPFRIKSVEPVSILPKAEREKAKMEAQVEKLKQQQKEKEQRQTSISDSELKRINSIAKLEQSLSLLENNFDKVINDLDIGIRR